MCKEAAVNVAPFGLWRLIAVVQAPPRQAAQRRSRRTWRVGMASSLRNAHGIRTEKPSPGRTV